MKDCSSCKVKPKAGEVYEETPCAKCVAPSHHDTRTSNRPEWFWKKLKQSNPWGLDKIDNY